MLLSCHFHRLPFSLSTPSHPKLLLPILLFLPFLPPHPWNSLTSCYLKLLMRDQIHVLRLISIQSSPKHWPNNTSSESDSGNSTRSFKRMRRRPRNVSPFMLGLMMTRLLSFTLSNLDLLGHTSASRQHYLVAVEVGHTIEVREGQRIFLKDQSIRKCVGFQTYLDATSRSSKPHLRFNLPGE
jgi:hypothetical protein